MPEPNGKLLVVGHQGNSASKASQGVVERRNADGSLDPTFGTNGQATTAVGTNQDIFAAALPDTDHLVTAGGANGSFVVTRYDSSGKPDSSFGKGGTQVTSLGTNADAYAVAPAPDGGVVAAGGADGNFAFTRYDSQGNLVSSFGQGGVDLFNAGSTNGVVGAAAVESGGAVVAAGSSGGNVVVLRLGADGNPDASFGHGGIVVVSGLAAVQNSMDGPDRSEGFFVQSNGKILVANHTADDRMAVARLNADGVLDTSFGAGGIASASFGGHDDADQIVMGPDGTIIAIGTTDAGGSSSIAVAEFNSSGNAVTSFGSNGRLTVPASVTPTSRELHVGDLVLHAFGSLDANNRLVVGASSNSTVSPTTAVLHRVIVTPNVSAPPLTELGTFGLSGRKNATLTVTTLAGTTVRFSMSGGSATALQTSDGKIQLQIIDAGGGASVSISTRGGSGQVTLADVVVGGTLRSLAARTADLAGTLSTSGGIGKLALGNITGAIAAGGGSISSISAKSASNAIILSGATVGADGQLTSGAAIFAAGSIGSIAVSGAITSSIIGAGLQPARGTALMPGSASSRYTVIGGASSRIKSITARGGADAATVFAAGAFGSVKLPKKVAPGTDPRFVLGA